ncbi:hypothetical protein [Lactovum odontotermitis]
MEKELFDDLLVGFEELIEFERENLNSDIDTRVIKPKLKNLSSDV